MKQMPLALLLFVSQNALADVTTAELLKSCGEKTTVVGRVDGKLKKVGETLNDYCRGYIDGHLAAQKGRICLEAGQDAHFVVSLLGQYVEEMPDSKGEEAGTSLSTALLRAYKCKPR
jgi:hypothetical protein